jgi:hypothetical protein
MILWRFTSFRFLPPRSYLRLPVAHGTPQPPGDPEGNGAEEEAMKNASHVGYASA